MADPTPTTSNDGENNEDKEMGEAVKDDRPKATPVHNKSHMKGHRSSPYPKPSLSSDNITNNNNNNNNNNTTTTSITPPSTPPTIDLSVADESASNGKKEDEKDDVAVNLTPENKKKRQKRKKKSDVNGTTTTTTTTTDDNTENTKKSTEHASPNDKNKDNNESENKNNESKDEDYEKTETYDDVSSTDEDTVEKKDPVNLTLPLEPTEVYQDLWNEEYVKLPFSSHNTYRKKSNPNKALSRWYLIETVLKSEITDSSDFEEVIKAYNSRKGFDFSGLHDYFDSETTEDETKEFFTETLPKIISLCLLLPSLIQRPIPLLVKSVDQEILLSQHQIASLLANGFLCTYPHQGGGMQDIFTHYSNRIHTLFEAPCTPKKAAKLKAIIHYFSRVTKNMPTGFVSFHRQVLDEFPEWGDSKQTLSALKIMKEGNIEDDGEGLLQVDFANKMIGGGVLGSGSVQEEIRFVLNPELIVSRLFTSEIEDNEAVIIKGAERFSLYKGYSDNFEWAGDYIDKTKLDQQGRRDTTIVAMDAIHLKKPKKQYSQPLVERELNKAYCGFYETSPAPFPAVATGHWGCGVFGGDRYLKSIIQQMAASVASRDVVYFTFGDDEFADKLMTMVSHLREKKVTIGSLFQAFREFNALQNESKSSLEVFDYLEVRFNM